jgi:hypothetical protein
MRTLVRAGLIPVFLLAACDLSAPVWNADYLFPIDFPDIELADYALVGEIPDVDLPFTTPVETQDITGFIETLLGDDLNSLDAEVITSTTVNVTGSIEVSIAQSPTDLFQSGRSIIITIPIAAGTDTTSASVNVDVVRNAAALYYQSRGTLRGQPGGTPVGPTDEIGIDVNLLVNYQVTK